MEGRARTSLIAICIVGLVALVAVILILKGGITGDAQKIFSSQCFDFCREKMCNSIGPDDRGHLYPCINTCLNDCWKEYSIKGNPSNE